MRFVKGEICLSKSDPVAALRLPVQPCPRVHLSRKLMNLVRKLGANDETSAGDPTPEVPVRARSMIMLATMLVATPSLLHHSAFTAPRHVTYRRHPETMLYAMPEDANKYGHDPRNGMSDVEADPDFKPTPGVVSQLCVRTHEIRTCVPCLPFGFSCADRAPVYSLCSSHLVLADHW